MRLLTPLLRALPLTSVLLAACNLAPAPQEDYLAQAAQAHRPLSAWSQVVEGKPTAYLDQLIRSPQLDALLDEALAANPSLQQTLLTLQIRRAEQRQTGAARLPGLEAGLSASKEEQSDSSYTGSLTASWEADIWGKLADDSRAAGKEVAAQQARLQLARSSLAAEVMKAWLTLIAQQRSIDIEQRRLESLEQNEQFILQRYRSGLGELEDLDSARTSLASSRATLAAYREALAEQRRSLQRLRGRLESETLAIPASYPDTLLPLASLPAQTLQRRADLQAAYLAIEAASLRTQVAYKALLPSISLTAALEDVASSPASALLTHPAWSLLGQLTAPLYQGGQLQAAVDVARLQTAYAYQSYRDTLLDAVKEIEDKLGQERALATQQAHIETALTHARNNLDRYRQSYRTGLVSMLDLLSVQQQTYDLESQLNNLVNTRLGNRIDLGLALGLGVHQ